MNIAHNPDISISRDHNPYPAWNSSRSTMDHLRRVTEHNSTVNENGVIAQLLTTVACSFPWHEKPLWGAWLEGRRCSYFSCFSNPIYRSRR